MRGRESDWETALVVASALLWLAVAVLGAVGRWHAALLALLPLLLSYGLLGVRRAGRFDLRLVGFPILAWLGLWAAAFCAAGAGRDAGTADVTATVLGLQPSFAWIVLLYWLLPSLVMALGFLAVRDRWLPAQRWEEFLRRVNDGREPRDGARGEGR